MRATSFLTCLWLMLALPTAVGAQPAGQAEPAPDAEDDAAGEPTDAEAAAGDDEAAEAEAGEEAVEPEPEAGAPAPVTDPDVAPARLEPPQLEPLEVAPPPPAPELEPAPEPELPDPAEAAALMDESEPEEQEEEKRWKLPRPVFSMHGYFRVRTNLYRKLHFGRPAAENRSQTYSAAGLPQRTSVDPFDYFLPADSSFNDNDPSGEGNTVEGGCNKSAGADGRCSRKLQISTDMRLRLKPEIALGEDVRIKAWIDVLDNVAFGTIGRDPNERIDVRDTVVARRAWGEVSDRDLGELRFGRMGADWGLGIVDNGGDRQGIDSDFSSDVDRMMALTNLGGFYLMGAYTWAAQGAFVPGQVAPAGVPLDIAQKDDLNEITLAVAKRDSPEKEAAALARGDVVFNVGTYFIWRKQVIEANPDWSGPTDTTELPFRRLNEKQFVPDLWLKLQWEGLRVELEGAVVAGSIDGGCPRLVDRNGSPQEGREEDGVSGGTCKLRQFGAALESEYRLIDDKLGIYMYGGYASGDRQGYGLAQTNNLSLQRVSNDNDRGSDAIGTFSFHPDYRVDLILFRSVMRSISGAYYMKPSISFDFLRNPFGRRLGGKFDVIYSRSSRRRQTWGGNPNLGVELDLSLYYRSEDGPDPLDGFYATLDWGVLFPLKGLQYRDDQNNYQGGDAAIVLRSVLGIAF